MSGSGREWKDQNGAAVPGGSNRIFNYPQKSPRNRGAGQREGQRLRRRREKKRGKGRTKVFAKQGKPIFTMTFLVKKGKGLQASNHRKKEGVSRRNPERRGFANDRCEARVKKATKSIGPH